MKKVCILLLLVLLSRFNLFSQIADSLTFKFDSTRIDTEQVHILIELSNLQIDIDFKTSWGYANKAFNLSKQLNYEKGIALSNFTLGRLSIRYGIVERTVNYLQDALNYYKNIDDFQKVANLTSYFGQHYSQIDDFNKSVEYYKDFYIIAKENKLLEDEILALARIGYSYLQFNYDSAYVYLTKTLELSKEYNIRPSNINNVILNTSGAYFFQGNYQKSLELALELENGFSERSYSTKISLSYLLGIIYHRIGDFENAIRYFNRGDLISVDSCEYMNLGNVYEIKYMADTMRNNYKSAFENLQKNKNYILENKNKKFENSLANFQALYELEKKEAHIKELSQENKIVRLKSKESKLKFYISLFLALLFFIITVLIYRLLRLKNEKNNLLKVANFELKEQKEELASLNEEISSQREDLYDKNIKLEVILSNLKETQTRLIHADKMASIGTLAAGIAHEINNPLNFIVGGLYIIKSNEDKECIEKSDELSDALKMIEEGAEKSERIVKVLMSYTGSIKSKFESNNLNEILEYALSILNHEISSDIKIQRKFSDSFNINCYKDKMLEVFISILKNCIFSLRENISENKKLILIETLLEQKNGIIIISNTGPKIPDNILPQVFDPFFTTKDPAKGTGLGLSTSYNIIKEHKGIIKLYNISEGVECKISIPIKS